MASYFRRWWPRNVTTNILLLVFLFVLFRLIFSGSRNGWSSYDAGADADDDDFVPPQVDIPGFPDFAERLQEAASEDMTVVIAVVDLNYLELALNFYISSLKNNDIRNVVFVSLDEPTCDRLSAAFPELRRRCFRFANISTGSDAHHGKNFKEKTHLRRVFILEALKLHYNVLATDVDMVFVENPLPDMKKTCGKCDVAIMWDDHQENYDTGLVYARPTERTIAFYNRLASYELSHGSGRLALNSALREAQKRKTHPLRIQTLNKKKYKAGIEFFERNRCPESRAYKDVLVVHNNYIMEAPNKVFRLKECMLWDWDGFDGYFSNTSRRYLTVETLGPPGYPEHQSLLNAFSLARLLRRTVVLPQLECKKTRCNLLTRMYDHSHLHFIGRFDAATDGNYRESTFLRNPRVPSIVKDSVSPLFHISFKDDSTKVSSHGEPVRHLVPADVNDGPTVRELSSWLAGRPEKVLRFDSLTGWFSHIKHADILGESLVKVIRQL